MAPLYVEEKPRRTVLKLRVRTFGQTAQLVPFLVTKLFHQMCLPKTAYIPEHNYWIFSCDATY
jgi:hypothetical protein